MLQAIIVYMIIGVALMGLARFTYRKLKALGKDKSCNVCSDCPLKDQCITPACKKNKTPVNGHRSFF